MAENDFLSFAIGGAANVVDQATYAALPAIAEGYESGIAQSAQLNKTWRQSATIAYAFAQFIVSQIDQDVLDNGDPDTIVAQFEMAVQQAATIKPAPRILTLSDDIATTLTDYLIGFNRTVGVAATGVSIINGMQPGQEFVVQDLVGNFNANPVTITPPAGSINGLANFACNVDRGRWVITYWGSNIYTIEGP